MSGRRVSPGRESALAPGFTVAEVLVALAVVTVALVALATVIPVASHALQEGSQLSIATFLAEQAVERVRSAAWTTTPLNDCLGVSATTDSPPAGPCGGLFRTTVADESIITGFPGYRRATRVASCAAAPGCGAPPFAVVHPGLRLVSVTVSYSSVAGVGGGAGLKAVTLESLVAQR